ncbi:MAG: glycosyltransferase family 2 protein [Gemmatimonadota bacterium]|nr:glycosyltransferase family 2 protein [Gemmatimonadota bacterium]
MPEPSFGVVLLNWNGYPDTESALESLLAATPPPARVIVVDNGSVDDSLTRLHEWRQRLQPSASPQTATAWLTIVEAGQNLGFAGGNNVGLRELAASGDLSHFLLLNNDATVAPDYFARISDALVEFPDAALLGCVIFHHPARDKVWFAGGYEVPYRALMLHHYELPASKKPQETPFVTGCAMVVSRALYESQGGLAECYNPIYWEDTDYSFRARTNGWRVLLVPMARVFHKVSASVGSEKTTPRVAYWQNRNRGYYVRRNYRGVDRAVALSYLAVTKPARAVVEVLRGRPAMGSAILRGFVRGLIGDIA